ncbi:MAG: acetolactate synthase large subunit [Gammaproteobacteria bacterium]|nr:acetolactate synthase large subunit [Gammaproteobacteria bacterium]
MKVAELFVRCLETEGVRYVFGIPGEENIDFMDALLDSKLEFILTRHEQGAAFMADVCGRLTGRAGVCLATLGPGATNLVTGVADANMDRAPVVALAGQVDTGRMHKESHQHLDLVKMFEPISKYSTQIRAPGVVPEVIRKAFKDAEREKPGVSFIELPEDIADMQTDGTPLEVQRPSRPYPTPQKVEQAAKLISDSQNPIVLAGNGVIRGSASDELVAFADKLNIPVATTFMAKGAMPFSHSLSLGTVGIQDMDYVASGFEKADLVISVGYDLVEYSPAKWNPNGDKKIIHIDATPAEVDAHYVLEAGVVGDIAEALGAIADRADPRECNIAYSLRQMIVDELQAWENDQGFPVKPQKIVSDLRRALGKDDIAVSDVGAHKMWMARMYQAEAPNTCIISNGFASMGIALPGAIAAKLIYPDRKAVAVTGDAGFLMNCQELETAVRLGLEVEVLIWNDSKYGLIEWHQNKKFGRNSHIDFTNPDFVKFAESFGAKGYRVESAGELLPTLEQALSCGTVAIIDCPVDYRENMILTEKLGNLKVRI